MQQLKLPVQPQFSSHCLLFMMKLYDHNLFSPYHSCFTECMNSCSVFPYHSTCSQRSYLTHTIPTLLEYKIMNFLFCCYMLLLPVCFTIIHNFKFRTPHQNRWQCSINSIGGGLMHRAWDHHCKKHRLIVGTQFLRQLEPFIAFLQCFIHSKLR